MAWVVAQNVLDAWIGDDAPTDTALVDVWVGKAERLIKSHVPDLQTRIDDDISGDLLADTRDVVVDAVIRKFRNPEGLRQVTDNTGPFGNSRTYGGNEPGALYLTDEDLRKLRGTASAGGAFTIDTIPATSPFYTGS